MSNVLHNVAHNTLGYGSFYGEKLRSREVAGLLLSEREHKPTSRIPLHSHDYAYFCLVLRGSFAESSGKMKRTYAPSNLIFHPAHESHSECFHDDGGRCFNIQIDNRLLDRMQDHASVFEQPASFNGGEIVLLAMKLHHELRCGDEMSGLVIEGLALEILGQAVRYTARSSAVRRPGWLEHAREIIHAQFTEPISLSSLAESVNVHPVHLAREFRRHHRASVGEYVRRLRVEFACKEMLGSEAPLAEIALAAGFSDQSQFSKTFKKIMCTTPLAFRQTSRLR